MTGKKLYRSRDDKFLAGVCGGLADYFNTDSNLIRILWIILILFKGAGLFVYLIAWLIIPEEY
ncbi:PspC domain-containing protein [Methanobrevibacter boviskoreani]|uniref:PspC domain-containing protein n=1 Tax=Methanobrevibacter boviskoreani TaxID=1348249 RepID=UPI0023A8D52D|nr:PspC domain-containing protein [Methanobrevibacter boviskoreani]MCI6774993.1 PspC domain-containing protein [Methanobrevibacter boviskoreani]MCI6929712.1 PspC domain-containing protein [Methanobrevibacter boviskoreani]MDY5614210.1 PspC domain-containing protein [Methanobrevibacter boviskoreani]